MSRAAAVLFDKDGTLFDFTASWAPVTRAALLDLAAGDPARCARYAAAIGFDLARDRFDPDSPVIAGTGRDAAERLAAAGAGPSDRIEAELNARAARARPVPAVPLRPLLARLADHGLRLGVATNDAEAAALVHLRAEAVADLFAFVAGYDSGHGQKPDPGPLLAFAGVVRVAARDIVMVGDSLHDLPAGRAAGMKTVAVLTGPAPADTLAPFADVVLSHVGHLPAWLGLPPERPESD